MEQHSQDLDKLRSSVPLASDDRLVQVWRRVRRRISTLMSGDEYPRIPGWRRDDGYETLVRRWSVFPDQIQDIDDGTLDDLICDFIGGVVNWRSPDLHYNLGSAVSVAALVAYAVALDLNVYLINDGLAGNVVAAERAVAAILGDLAGISGSTGGLFTFGGTGTILYAIKSGLRRAFPESQRQGIPSSVRVVLTEEAHFSHDRAVDWLGVGLGQVLRVPIGEDGRTSLPLAESILRRSLSSGDVIPVMGSQLR